MNMLKKHMHARDKKIVVYLVMIAAAGVLLMLWGRVGRDAPGSQIGNLPPSPVHEYAYDSPQAMAENQTYHRPERALEEELEAFFALVAGAGQVRVMVSALGNTETVFAVDSNSSRSHIIEEDAQGGTRDQRQYSNQEQTVIITDRNGIDQPLVLKEIAPRVEGIVIIAQGGDDPFVRDALTRAAMTVLGVEAHRVQVLAMNTSHRN